MGAASGIAMNSLAKGLAKATGNALSLEEAMRATALTMSSGFGVDTIDRLGDVARKASVALGRDTADSLSRLVRGATKLEPELLDELGIMVRLDDATTKYAQSINKSAADLTSFEKRQGFMNAVLEEGERKFAALGQVETNPYDKLSAAFQNLTKSVLNFVNNTGVTAFISLLGNSMTLLTGVIIFFGRSLVTSAIPALVGMTSRLLGLATVSYAATVEKIRLTKAFTGGTSSAQKFVTALQSGENVEKSYAKALRFTNQSINQRRVSLEQSRLSMDSSNKTIENKNKAYKESVKTLRAVNMAYYKNSAATISMGNGAVLAAAAEGRLADAFAGLKTQVLAYSSAANVARLNSSMLGSAQLYLASTLNIAALGVKTLALSFLSLIPYIGPVMIVTGLLYEGLTALFNAFKSDSMTKFETEASDLEETMTELANTFQRLHKETNKGDQYIAFSNAFSTIEAKIRDTIKASEDMRKEGATLGNSWRQWVPENSMFFDADPQIESFVKLVRSTDKTRAAFNKLYPEANNIHEVLGFGSEQTENLKKAMTALSEELGKPAAKFAALAQSAGALSEPLAKFMSKLKVKTPVDELVTGFDDLAKTSKEALDTGNIDDYMAVLKSKGGGDLSKILGMDDMSGLMGQDTAAIAKVMDERINTLSTGLKIAQEAYQVEGKNIEIAKSELELAKASVVEKGKYLNIVEFTNQGIQASMRLVDAQIVQNNLLLTHSKDDIALLAEAKRLDAERLRLKESLIDKAEKEVLRTKENVTILQQQQKYDKFALDMQQKSLANLTATIAARKTLLEIEQKKKNAKDPSRDSSVLNAQDIADINKKLQADRIKANADEYTLKVSMIEAEYALLRVTMSVLKAEADNINGKAKNAGAPAPPIDMTSFNYVYKNIDDMQKQSMAAAGASYAAGFYSIIQDTADVDEAAGKERIRVATLILNQQQKYDKVWSDMQAKANAEANERINATKTLLEIEQKQKNAKDSSRSSNELTPSDNYVINKKLQDDRIKATQDEYTLKVSMIEAEYALLKVNMGVLKAEGDIINAKAKAAGLPPAIDMTGFNSVYDNIDKMKSKSLETAAKSYVASYLTIIQDTADLAQGAIKQGMEATGSTADRATAAYAPGAALSEGSDANVSEKFATVSNVISPMLEQLRELGPEGELVATVTAGAMAMGDAFGTLGEKMAAGTATTADKLGAVAAGISAVSSIMAASSKAKIAGIDAEIAAEQKRDGKSAGSIAKIQALEKKKEAAQKKAFEMNKKLQIAQIAISTAAAMVSAAAAAASAAAASGPAAPITFASVFAGIGGFIAALGAASIAIVASTSFQGGGSVSGAGGAPTSVAVGNRESSVDLAKARSPSGELAYARGAQGSGTGMTDYTPSAFTGMKYRATGGNTSFMVGEQGPEIFTPERPGRITPADDTANMGGSTNVTFTINAIDSRGIEEVLNSQRGNLVGIIREAANAHGESFLENVNVESYQGSAGGYDAFSKYPKGAVRNQ